MRRWFRDVAREELVLGYAFVKWAVLSVAAGVVVGAAAAVFLLLLGKGIGAAGLLGRFRVLLLPFGLVASVFTVRTLAPEAAGHGTEKVIEAVHQRSGRISLPTVPVKLAATIITIASGGSAGKEGPCAQIGAGLTSAMAGLLRLNDADRKKLVVCGISAGFSAIFGTPVSGAIFGLEVLYIGQVYYDVMLPAFISGIVAFQTAAHLGVHYADQSLAAFPALASSSLAWVALSGLFFGLVALIHIEIVSVTERYLKGITARPEVKAFGSGVALLLLSLLLGTRYFGLGTEFIEAAVSGEPVQGGAFLVKSFFTGVTLAAGGTGGILTPTFFVGAGAGSFFASLFHLDLSLFSSIGFVAVLAGAANTPIAATIMATELFGGGIASFAAVACIISFAISGHRSIYPSQILARPKSRVFQFSGEKVAVDKHSHKINLSETIIPTVVSWLRGNWESLTRLSRGGKKRSAPKDPPGQDGE